MIAPVENVVVPDADVAPASNIIEGEIKANASSNSQDTTTKIVYFAVRAECEDGYINANLNQNIIFAQTSNNKYKFAFNKDLCGKDNQMKTFALQTVDIYNNQTTTPAVATPQARYAYVDIWRLILWFLLVPAAGAISSLQLIFLLHTYSPVVSSLLYFGNAIFVYSLVLYIFTIGFAIYKIFRK